jgi:hypothetical protein
MKAVEERTESGGDSKKGEQEWWRRRVAYRRPGSTTSEIAATPRCNQARRLIRRGKDDRNHAVL